MKCTECGKNIKDSERRTVLATYKGKKLEGKDDFHLDCWKDFFNKNVKKAAKLKHKIMMALAEKMAAKAMKEFNKMKKNGTDKM